MSSIEKRRELVIKHYDAAKSSNDYQFSKGNPSATEEYIFQNQMIDAGNIVNEFYRGDALVVSVQKKTKVGADGLMIEIAKLVTTHIDDEFAISFEDIRIITGMSNTGWETDMKDKSPMCFRENIFHHGKLSKSHLKGLSNALIIIDEIDTGDKESQVLHRTLQDAKLTDIEYIKRNRIRFVVISATMIREQFHLQQWGKYHKSFKMTIPNEYVGHSDFLKWGIIQESYPISEESDALRWVREDILENYEEDFRVHIIRLKGKGKNKNAEIIEAACFASGVVFKNHTADDRLSEKDKTELFEKPLKTHVVMGVKGFFRRANLIPNQWKLRIGATHELHTKSVDNNVQIQGLPGRMTGYWRSILESGHKTGPYRTCPTAVREYIDIYEDPLGGGSYRASGIKMGSYGNKLVSTIFSPDNISGLDKDEVVPLPEFLTDSRDRSVGDSDDYDFTDPCQNSKTVKEHLESVLVGGQKTTYGIKEDGFIKVRGKLFPILVYTSREKFKREVPYWGISKKPGEKSITARIMPVKVLGELKWVGIYSRRAVRVPVVVEE
jgi:hypothetical protein